MQILAIDKISEGVTAAILEPFLPQELAATINLYLQEKIRSFYFRKDRPGVVFIMECPNVQEAKEILAALPMVQEKLLDFDLIPIGPLMPLGQLLKRAGQ
jgi:hypothetical protein